MRNFDTTSRIITTAIIVAVCLMATAGIAGESVWIEGEDYITSDFNLNSWYMNSDIRKDLLSPGVAQVSDGDWHGHYSSNPTPVSAGYEFSIIEAGQYIFWIRLNPGSTARPGVYRYQIDGGPWVDMDIADVREELDLVEPGIDVRFIAWVKVASLPLTAGEHTIAIQIIPGPERTHGAIDAMCFTGDAWTPAGVIKPSDPVFVPGADVWFPLVIGDDAFSADSIIDMSNLIDSPAGSHGFLNSVGDRFVFEDGKPIKFWGVNAHMAATVQTQQQQARFYTKHGINLVREHPIQDVIGLLKKDTDTGERFFDPEALDRFDKWFYTLKEQGIYMTWSCFFRHVITPDDGYPADLYAELPDFGAGKSTYGLVNMMQQLQDSQWLWVEKLLTHVNPYTQLAYKDDPTLVMLEVHNEDCIFWHSPLGDLEDGDVYPLHTAILQEMWRQWVADQYGDDVALAAAWGAGMRGDDSITNSAMKIYAAWEMEADGPRFYKTTERKRMGDFIRFLAQKQKGFYQQREQRLRALGYKAVTVSTAWKAGGPAAHAANLWCDDAMGAIDRHRYFGGGEGGRNIAPGWVINDSHLSQPGSGILGGGMYQVEDKPFVMSEWACKVPTQWKSEIAPLYAFYGMGLQGWDGSMHFVSTRPRMGNGWPGMRPYVTETPHNMGQFPALAFAIYRDHFQQGTIAGAIRLGADDVFQGVDALTQDIPSGGYGGDYPSTNLDTPVETLAIGRVSLKIADGQQQSTRNNWQEFWDQTGQTIQAVTGQLTWDYGNRVVLAHGDHTQGIIGFAGGSNYDLPGVTVTVDTPFVSLLFTPLDNRPLLNSSHILVTALARDKQYGAEYSLDGTQLLATGGPPLLLEPVQATITLKGHPIQSVKKVDVYGVPTDELVTVSDNTFTIDGRYATYYYEIKRDPTAIAGRYVFYNNSSFDGNDPASNALDDQAIATDKVALLPGQTATFENYTSYVLGINGLMIDIFALPGAIDTDDFSFKTGNVNDPVSWTTAPLPSVINVRQGAGDNGSDRITILWPDGVMIGCWLQVTVKANTATGLNEPAVFYFGNAVGETGNLASDAIVDATDEIACRNNPRHFMRPALIYNVHDFDRDCKVDATDEIISRNNVTDFSSALKLLTMP